MAPVTRQTSQNICATIISNLLDTDGKDMYFKLLEYHGIKTIEDLVTLQEDDIDSFVTIRRDSNAVVTNPLHKGGKRLLILLVGWLNIKKQGMDPTEGDNWLALKVEDFDEWRIGVGIDYKSISSPSHAPNVPSVVNTQKLELESFKRSIKRDATIYPTLREDKDWDNWNRAMLSLARTHDVSEIFDPKYVPTNDTKDLFDQKQMFMYSILNRVVLTDMGKTIVRQHEQKYDAQKVYSLLLDYAKVSTAADINIDTIIGELQNLRLDSRWPGSNKGFILYWRDRMRVLEELTHVDEHYTDAHKKRMLDTAVRGVDELRSIKAQDDHSKALHGKGVTYIDYVELLISAATRRDASLKLPPNRNRRNINLASSSYGYEDVGVLDNDFNAYYDNGYGEYANDNDLADVNLEVNVMRQQRIPPDIWQKLPQEARDYFISNNRSRGNYNRNSRQANNQGSYNRPNNSSSNLPRQANIHQVEDNIEDSFYDCNDTNSNVVSEPSSDTPSTTQVNKTEQAQTHPGDIRNVLTSASKQAKKPSMQAGTNKEFIWHEGKKYFAGNTIVSYSTFSQQVMSKLGSLIDRGANGGVAGGDVMLLETTHRTCDVSGINNHTMSNLPICTCAGLVNTTEGNIIVILHQYAYSGSGNTIHSAAQIEYFGNRVDDKSVKVGGRQHIITLDNHVLPLSIRNGLAYLDMTMPTQYEFETLEHVVLTSDVDWDPSSLDYEADKLGDVNLEDNISNLVLANMNYLDYVDNIVDTIDVKSHNIKVNIPDFEVFRPNFSYAPTDIIKKTFNCTTQWARLNERYPFRKHFKSRFPALNVTRRNEPVATDTIFSDTPAVDNGCYLAQIFVGLNSKVTDVYPMKLESDFVATLQDNIRERGAMSKLVSDFANVEMSAKVKEVLRQLYIQEWQSEPYHQHQNYAERRYQTVKRYVNTILDKTGAPPSTWFLCLKYVCYVLNLTYVDKLGTVPLEKLTGQTQDISILLPFTFWEPVYYATGDALAYNASVSFPSKSAEAKGRFVGFGEHVGDALTFLVLTNETNRLIYRSSVRSAIDTSPNLRLETLEGEMSNPNNAGDFGDDLGSSVTQTTNSNKLGESFYENLNLPNENAYDDELESDKLDSIRDYNNALDHLSRNHEVVDDNEDKLWQFNKIISHIGPLKTTDKNYKGSKYNLLIEWGDGSQTYEPLTNLAADDPVSCAVYARENNLLNKPGWKRFRNLANDEARFKRMLNINKQSFKPSLPKHKFGFQVPRTVNEAHKLDSQLNQTKWAEAIKAELDQIHSYNTFKNLGKNKPAPEGYKRIKVHFVFDVKHDGRHKARLVAGGHLTDEPDDSVYSSVVSLRDLRLVVFAGEQNNLDIWAADVGNAYLESYTKEKVYIVAGPEFGDLEGSTLVINKALYGLRSSGLRWHERFADTLRDLKFKPSKASVDVWMRPADGYYEYIAVYVDDLAIVAKNPQHITDTLTKKYGYKLKGVGPIDYHLGGNFARDSDGTLRYGPKKYIDKLIMSYTKLFGSPPTERSSPLVHGDHPELDDSPELDAEGIKQYQSMIGALQWCTTLGRFDILAAVMTMSRFRVAPKIGHLDRLKRIYGYLKKHKNGAIRFRTNIPDYSKLESKTYDWSSTVYEDVEDDKPSDLPEFLGNPVVTTTYVDANLMHCEVTGRASTGILHLVNGTPVEWYSKRQSTVQSATYGSEFVAARIATDQIVDLRLTLNYLGIKVIRSIMFGDNQSVVTSATIPQSKLNKRHVALSYHRVREAVANKTMEFFHIDGKDNPADMLSKFAGNQQFWPILRPLLFWGGNMEGLDKDEDEDKASLVKTA